MSYLSLSKGLNRRAIVGVLLIAVLLSLPNLTMKVSAQETGSVQTLALEPVAELTLSNYAQVEHGITVGQLKGVGWMSYLAFDITSLPTDAIIQSINLKVKSYIIDSGNKYVNAYSVSSNWTESTINWDNRPTQGKFIDVRWVYLDNEWYVWDCTGKLFSENNTVSVALQLSSGFDGFLMFNSPPVLEIQYTLPDPTPTPTVYEPIDYAISFIVLFGIIAVIGVVGFIVLRSIFPKNTKYPPPPPPNN